jgi:hypothetical protein
LTAFPPVHLGADLEVKMLVGSFETRCVAGAAARTDFLACVHDVTCLY